MIHSNKGAYPQVNTPIDDEELGRLYSLLNKSQFGGILPDIEVKFVSSVKLWLGTCHVLRSEDRMHRIWIALNKRLKSSAESLVDTLLHEMIHVWQYTQAVKYKDESYTDISAFDRFILKPKEYDKGHGKYFHQHMSALNAQGFNIKISSGAPVGEEADKPMYGMLLSKEASDDCVVVYSHTDLGKFKESIIEQVSDKIGHNYYTKYTYFKTTDANIYFTVRATKDGNLPKNIENIQVSYSGVKESILESPLTTITGEEKAEGVHVAKSSKAVDVPPSVVQLLGRMKKWRYKEYYSFLMTAVINIKEYSGVKIPSKIEPFQDVDGIPINVVQYISSNWMDITDIEIKRSGKFKVLSWYGSMVANQEIYSEKKVSDLRKEYDRVYAGFAKRVDPARFKRLFAEVLSSELKSQFKKRGATTTPEFLAKSVNNALAQLS